MGYRLRLFRSFARKNRPTACFSLASLTSPNPILLRKILGSRSPVSQQDKKRSEDLFLSWRREWDSNPRWVAPYRFSRAAPSTTRSSLHAINSNKNANKSLPAFGGTPLSAVACTSPWLLTSMIIPINSSYRERTGLRPVSLSCQAQFPFRSLDGFRLSKCL